MKHTVKYWDKKLLSLQRLADSVGYDIDNDQDYIAACACQPATVAEFCKMKHPRPEILPLFLQIRLDSFNYHIFPRCFIQLKQKIDGSSVHERKRTLQFFTFFPAIYSTYTNLAQKKST